MHACTHWVPLPSVLTTFVLLPGFVWREEDLRPISEEEWHAGRGLGWAADVAGPDGFPVGIACVRALGEARRGNRRRFRLGAVRRPAGLPFPCAGDLRAAQEVNAQVREAPTPGASWMGR